MKTNVIEFLVKRIAYGSEEIDLVFGDTTLSFLASYIGREPVSGLIRAAATLPVWEHAELTWLDEPGYLKTEFRLDSLSGRLSVDIEMEDTMPEDAESPEKFHFVTDYEVFKEAVIKVALNVLKTYGMIGFMQSWSERTETFPVAELLSLMGGQSSQHEKSDSFRSNIKDELQLLMNAVS